MQRLEQQGVIAKDTAQNLTIYLDTDENTQREIFDNSMVSCFDMSFNEYQNLWAVSLKL